MFCRFDQCVFSCVDRIHNQRVAAASMSSFILNLNQSSKQALTNDMSHARGTDGQKGGNVSLLVGSVSTCLPPPPSLSPSVSLLLLYYNTVERHRRIQIAVFLTKFILLHFLLTRNSSCQTTGIVRMYKHEKVCKRNTWTNTDRFTICTLALLCWASACQGWLVINMASPAASPSIQHLCKLLLSLVLPVCFNNQHWSADFLVGRTVCSHQILPTKIPAGKSRKVVPIKKAVFPLQGMRVKSLLLNCACGKSMSC